MRLAMKASLESAQMDEKEKQKQLRKAKKEAKRARKAEFAASTNETAAAFSVDAQPSPAPTSAPTTGQPSLAPTSQPSPGPTTTTPPTATRGTCECVPAAPTKTFTPAAKSPIYGCPRVCSLSD